MKIVLLLLFLSFYLYASTYCTTFTEFHNPTDKITFICLQSNGQWLETGNPLDITAINFNYPNLSKTSTGKPLIGYGKSINNEQILALKTFNGTDWVDATPYINYDASNKVIPVYSQFGGNFIESSGTFYSFWTGGTDAYISKSTGGVWQHSKLIYTGITGELVRHPEILKSGTSLYAYFGQPFPFVWNISTGIPVAIGGPTVSNVYTLYTQLAKWNNNLVLAFNSASPKSGALKDTTDVIKVALYNGSSWSWLSTSIQDIPSHFTTRPFLFIINNELYIMYADYTTIGVQTSNYSQRFRVKKWNGSTWQIQGTESETVAGCQRFEFLQDGDSVLFSAMRWKNGNLEQVVLKWNSGGFTQLGEVVKTYLDSSTAPFDRVGNIISY